MLYEFNKVPNTTIDSQPDGLLIGRYVDIALRMTCTSPEDKAKKCVLRPYIKKQYRDTQDDDDAIRTRQWTLPIHSRMCWSCTDPSEK